MRKLSSIIQQKKQLSTLLLLHASKVFQNSTSSHQRKKMKFVLYEDEDSVHPHK